MQSVPRISSLVLKTTILLGAVVAVTQPVMGNCGSASIIGTAGAGGNSFIWTQNYMSPMCFSAAYPPFQNNQPPVSPQLEGRFWKLGTGDAATGMGDDNGTFDFVAAGDVLIYTYGPYFFAADLFTTWNPAPVDGVVDGCIGDGNCNCVLLTDQTSNGTVGHFALLAAQSDAAFDTHHNMPGPGTCPTQGGDILIVPMPVPEVTGSTATISMV